ncbi:hypothetical protein AcW1_001088 [Taiwanofungus camphoratus]|nr:hypothetical protein AcV5_005002 [Antrodia cinnamomea]KAI0964219.1 hypothetical protein AcW1_001088 [Antrodia cinnamomea]
MSSNKCEAPNASGLTPSETKCLKERSAQPHEDTIIQSIKELYTCRPSENTYEIYTHDAVFHDPVGIAEGIKSIREQFNGLVKVCSYTIQTRVYMRTRDLQIFPRAEITQLRVLENPPSVPKSTILIDQDVAYYRNPTSSPTATVNSLLTLQTNDAHRVTRHTEEWDHKRQTTREDGFLGLLNEQRKKLTAGITGMFVSQEPPKTKNQ